MSKIKDYKLPPKEQEVTYDSLRKTYKKNEVPFPPGGQGNIDSYTNNNWFWNHKYELLIITIIGIALFYNQDIVHALGYDSWFDFFFKDDKGKGPDTSGSSNAIRPLKESYWQSVTRELTGLKNNLTLPSYNNTGVNVNPDINPSPMNSPIDSPIDSKGSSSGSITPNANRAKPASIASSSK